MIVKKTLGRLAPEIKYLRQGFDFVIGLDEAGRGPLAGPVVAAAVAVLHPESCRAEFFRLMAGVRDSKKISAQKREKLARQLMGHPAIAWGSGAICAREIDSINILEATKRAMARAIGQMRTNFGLGKSIFCLLDGNFPIDVPFAQRSVIGGDDKIFSIAAASIIAKVTRDRIMRRLDKKYPGYGFARHKGYPTAQHLARLARLGPCREHRFSFAPVKACSCPRRRSNP